MFPFWEPVIAPVLEAGGVRTVVEVGALRGDTTRQVVERLGPDGVLHVIDPVPGFDPTEQERELAGRYVFHRDLSLNVLDHLPPMDAALIDGDHNWYTVVNELRALRRSARAADAPLPILVLHDVGWPYGRRDLYYDPETIPAEHRQPHRQAGMRPGRKDLLPEGQGMSQGLWNAEHEGGPRNGVMTALEDFVAEHDRDLRTVVLPLYFGLAIVVEAERLARQPALRDQLDRLEGPEALGEMVAMGERIRLRAVAHHHTVVRRTRDRIEALADRYLDRIVAQHGPRDGADALRSRLDEARRAGAEGAVVLIAGPDVAPAVLVAAYRAAHEDWAPPIRVVVDPATADPWDRDLRLALAELDLPADGIEVVGPDWRPPAPDDVAVAHRASDAPGPVG